MMIKYIHSKKNLISKIFVHALCLIVVAAVLGCARQQTNADLSNKLVIVVDASISYRSRQSEAVEKAAAILEDMSKTQLKRWESQSDVISIISLDASPDTIWQGSLKDLKSQPPSFWKERFMARKDYASCTDVSSAFRLAASHLEGDSRYVSKYLFVFSDMLHEPPTQKMRSCGSPVKVSPEDFPWSNLSDVSVSIFWMPPDQKLLWRKAVQDRGLEGNFALYTNSESASVTIPTPPRPQEKITEKERKERQKARQDEIKSSIWSAVRVIFGIIVFAVSAMVITGYVIKRRRRQRVTLPQSRGTAHSTPVPVRPRPGARPVLQTRRPIPQTRRPIPGNRRPFDPQGRKPQ